MPLSPAWVSARRVPSGDQSVSCHSPRRTWGPTTPAVSTIQMPVVEGDPRTYLLYAMRDPSGDHAGESALHKVSGCSIGPTLSGAVSAPQPDASAARSSSLLVLHLDPLLTARDTPALTRRMAAWRGRSWDDGRAGREASLALSQSDDVEARGNLVALGERNRV